MTVRPVVIDTNVLISAALSFTSTPAQLLRYVLVHERIVLSEPTYDELASRLLRPKFDRYISHDVRKRFLSDIRAVADWASPLPGPARCRDASDDKFIELALAVDAIVLASGDDDLLCMRKAEQVPILNQAAALKLLQK